MALSDLTSFRCSSVTRELGRGMHAYLLRSALLVQFGEAPPIAFANRLSSRQLLPPPHDRVHVRSIELEPVTHSTGLLGRNQRGPRSQERIIDQLPGFRMVPDGPPHQLDRLLRPMTRDRICACASEWIQVRDFPQGRLFAISLPL